MALVKFGGGVTEMRGKLAGNVFSRNAAGAIVRKLTKPINPRTARQMAQRNIMATLVIAWNGLTQAQRDQWNVYGAATPTLNGIGETIFVAGFNWYVGNNSVIAAAGSPRVDDGPTTLQRAPLEGPYTPSVSEATQLISIVFDNTSDWANEDDAFIQITMSLPHTASSEFIGGPFRVAGFVEGDAITPPTSPATVPVPFPVAVGQRVEVLIKVGRADGRLSTEFRLSFAVSA